MTEGTPRDKIALPVNPTTLDGEDVVELWLQLIREFDAAMRTAKLALGEDTPLDASRDGSVIVPPDPLIE